MADISTSWKDDQKEGRGLHWADVTTEKSKFAVTDKGEESIIRKDLGHINGRKSLAQKVQMTPQSIHFIFQSNDVENLTLPRTAVRISF